MSETTDSPTEQKGLPAQEPISGIPKQDPVEPEGHAEEVESPAEKPAPEVPDTPTPVEQDEPAFFDRKEWEESLSGVDDPERVKQLRNLEKMLLGQWTKKNQALAQDRQKVEAYNAFMEQVERDPRGAIVDLQQQLGLSPQQAQQVVEEARGEKEYSTWDEVYTDFREQVLAEVRKEIAPAMQNVHKLTTQQVEAQFDSIDPDWRMYEDNIMTTLNKYPQMVNDISTLYRVSVPQEVSEQRAVKEALKRLEKQTKAAAPAAPTPTRSKGSTIQVKSFDDAVKKSKMDLGMI
jgi:hypothetical protein